DILGVERVGIYDSFFEMGGHSLKAMTLLARTAKAYGVEVPLQVLFETPTVYAIARFVSDLEPKAFLSIKRTELREWYPMSEAQRRIYIVSQLGDAGIAYNMPATALIEGNVEVERLEQAFGELVRRHESLRTSFLSVNGVPVQKVHDKVPFHITVLPSGEAGIESIADSFVRPFDLSLAPLMRIGLMKLDENKYLLLFDMHHLISDGVTIGILLGELAQLYAGNGLPELRLQYKDYAVWQNEQASNGYEEEEEYWLTKLGGELPVLQLLTDYPRPSVQSFEGDRVSVVLGPLLKEKLSRLAEQNNTTLYTVLLSAYYILLARYTGQDDIVIGTPTAGRNHADLEGIVGMFVQTFAIRSNIDLFRVFTDFLRDTRSIVLEAFDHPNYPFERLAEKLNMARDLSRNPIFDTLFSLQNAFAEVPEVGGMRVTVQETNFRVAKFDLTLQAKEEPDGITLDMDYSVKLFRKDSINRMLDHYVNLLQSIVASPGMMLGELNLLSEADKSQLVMEFNPAATEYPKHETIVHLFEDQAAMLPDRPALAYEGETLSYSELNGKANQLAGILRSEGVQSGTMVAVLVDRSMEMIIGILAVLKAGGAYVPIDPEHPAQRIKHFLTDSGASVLLTQRALAHLAQEVQYAGRYVLVDDAKLYRGETSNLNISIEPSHLANLTYTSGTTGSPKGNMVTHANILRTVKNTNYMEMTNQDIVLALSNYVFDAFMFDVFGALLNGAKLVLIPKNIVLDMSRLPQVMERESITILMITTALFNLLVDIRPDCLGSIRKVLFGGERASVEHVRKALRTAGPGKLLHMYGPSESTVFATYYPVDELADDIATLPIGKPVSNTTAYIFDSFGQLQPIGAAGELCVGGDGLVLGYFNRPELTEEKFVSHPFKEEERIYRTGDLARWLPDGNIEFIGRIDHQVKIRGQRVELGEIEQQLLKHKAIREAVVLAMDASSGETQLVAYVVADMPLTGGMLRDFAGKELPGYMVPSAFIQLEELPLTGNGKVDRRALPKPDVRHRSEAAYVPARTDTEARLVSIWQEVLGIPQIGVQDHFFELGGHSLKAMVMLAQIHRDLQVELPLKELFQSPTIEGLAQAIAKADKSSIVSLTPAEQREVYPVTSAQKRLYVLQQLEGADRSYNMPCVMRLDGPLQRERFDSAIRQLLQRHDALRTSFEMSDGQPVQRIQHQAEFTVSYEEATEQEAKWIIEEFVRPFDLEQSPLFRVGLIRIAEEQHLLLVDMHHIISDGASVSLLLEEITKLYAGESLEPLRLQYKDYAVWQQQIWAQSDTYRRQETYWLEQLSGELPVLSLPTDHVRPAVQSFAGDRMSFTLDPDFTTTVRNLAQKTETTLYMMLLASYSAFLAKLSGQSELIVGSPSAGRSHPDLAPMMGMFVHTFAVRTYPEGHKRFGEYLQEVKQTVLGGYENQDYPFDELVGKVQTHRDMSRNPLFDVVFGMQNADLNTFAMEGLSTETYPLTNRTAKFDLTLTATEEKDTIRFELEYNTALFHPETIGRWIGYFKTMLGHIVTDQDVPISEAAMLAEAEKRRILVAFNDTATEYPRNNTIHELFEEQAERVPDKAAVVLGVQQITYRELNARANRLARMLRAKGLQRDQTVGIMVEQSDDMMVGILAILKAGGAYVPIDPDYPDERVRYLLADSGAELVLTGRALAGRLQGTEPLYFDDPSLEQMDTTNLAHLNRPEDLAYVIYTSGSTGQPKGVMVQHRNVVRLVKNAGYVPFDDSCRMAQTGAISFDASTFELFGALLHGGTLYPVPKSTLLDVEGFSGFLQRHGITTMWLTSPLFNQLAQEKADMFAAVRHLIIGGDALVPRHVNQVRRVCPDLTLWNGYGPTENTTFSTCFRIEQDYAHQIPIGKPIGNSTAYILNSAGQPQPIGVPGELCVGGDGVARGYWNRPDLTEEKFVDNPFSPGERMYRTGDLARWLPDGHIEFLGRIDQQVKVRGFRIELGEIESQLMRVEGVNEAVVMTRQDETGANSLCAYVAGDRVLTTEELRAALSRTLPAYMVPSYFVQVDKMPLTPNGKVDRKALPEPEAGAGRDEYRAPRNEKEELLSDLWQDVLGAGQVGINDNFFSLGGDSIKAIQLAARLNIHGWKLEMKHLFQHPTIEQVSLYLQKITEGQADQAPVEGEVPLTPIQRWFFERRFTDSHHWNQAVMLYAPTGFKTEVVRRTLNQLARHHDALRMGYTIQDGNVVQFNRGPEESIPHLEVIRPDVPIGEVEQAILLETERFQASIDLTRGPLLKAALFQTDQGDHLLLVIHHLVVDGVSWRILLEDFAASYLQAANGGEMRLQGKSHSYRKWATELQDYADSRTLLKEIDYWRKLEQVRVMPIPKDHETGDHRMRNTRTVEFWLTASETERLTTRVHQAYHTEMNDILLTALGLAMREWCGDHKILVNLEGHGREEIIEGMNLSRTVGWFTTQYPVVLELPYGADTGKQIKRVKEDLRHIPHKGIGYGLLRYLTDDRHKSGL
ncbi:MAG: lchAA, partial [Cohnella sp.]|nr:lchAA [Cohnella sp.]